MIANTNKTNMSKSIALIAAVAMIVCAFALVIPSADAAGETTSVKDTAGLLNALSEANDGDVIELADGEYGSVNVENVVNKIYYDETNGYMSILVDKAVTIKAAAGATPEIYGSFIVTKDATIDGLTFNITYMTNYERNAVNILGTSATVKNCIFNMDPESTDLCNGICIWPASGTQAYTIAGNTFNSYKSTEDWASVAILVAENVALSNRMGQTGTSSELTMSNVEVFRMVSQNTYNGCDWKYSSTDYTASDVVGLRVLGESTDNFAQQMDYYAVNGSEYTILKQTSESISLSLGSTEKFVVAEDVTFNGTVAFENNSVSITAITAGAGGLTFSMGSVEISGIMTAADAQAKIEAAQGNDIVLKNLTITKADTGNTLNISGAVAVEGNVIVSEGVTVAIGNNSSLNVAKNAVLSVSGTVTVSETNGTLNNDGTISITDKDASIPEEMEDPDPSTHPPSHPRETSEGPTTPTPPTPRTRS